MLAVARKRQGQPLALLPYLCCMVFSGEPKWAFVVRLSIKDLEMKKLIITLIFALLATSAFATGVSSGKVSQIIVNAANFLFFTAGAKSGSPSCGNNDQWAISLDTAKGKSVYAMVLAARAADASVNVVGTGACASWGDREDVLFMYQ